MVPVVVGFEGEDVELPCVAMGNPPVTRTWSRNGTILVDDEKVTLVNDGEMLVLSDLEQEDGGQYNCTVSNFIDGFPNAPDTVIIELQVQSKHILEEVWRPAL